MAERLNDMADMIINEEGGRSADATLLYEAASALSSPCACGGEEPIDTDYEATLWHDYDDLYHLDVNLSKRLPSLRPREKVKVRVIVLEGKPDVA